MLERRAVLAVRPLFVAIPVAAALLVAGCSASAPRSTAPFGSDDRSSAPLAYAGRTIVFHDPLHGTQVEHYAAGGEAFLWYPGNRRTVPGRWEVRTAKQRICFRYGTQTFNPVTRRRGGAWNCTPLRLHRRLARASCAGDPFGLASGRLPFVLARGEADLARVLGTCGAPPPGGAPAA